MDGEFNGTVCESSLLKVNAVTALQSSIDSNSVSAVVQLLRGLRIILALHFRPYVLVLIVTYLLWVDTFFPSSFLFNFTLRPL